MSEPSALSFCTIRELLDELQSRSKGYFYVSIGSADAIEISEKKSGKKDPYAMVIGLDTANNDEVHSALYASIIQVVKWYFLNEDGLRPIKELK